MIKKLSDTEYQVESMTHKDEFYNVKRIGKKWICDCPASVHKANYECKHVVGLKMYLASKRKDRDVCPECGSYLSIERNGLDEEAVCRVCGYTEVTPKTAS